MSNLWSVFLDCISPTFAPLVQKASYPIICDCRFYGCHRQHNRLATMTFMADR